MVPANLEWTFGQFHIWTYSLQTKILQSFCYLYVHILIDSKQNVPFLTSLKAENEPNMKPRRQTWPKDSRDEKTR